MKTEEEQPIEPETAQPAEADRAEQPEAKEGRDLEAILAELKRLALEAGQGEESELLKLIETLKGAIALERTKVAKEAFIAAVHEFAQPLTALRAYADLLLRDLPPDSYPQLRHFAEGIIKAIKRLQEIVEIMRKFIDSGVYKTELYLQEEAARMINLHIPPDADDNVDNA